MAKIKKNSTTDNAYLQKLNKMEEEKKEKKKSYVNPARKPWGKVLIVILGLAMCLGSVISLIYLVINNILH
jgi:hypothetical protein